MRRWREAMANALYGPGGFFVRPDAAPAAHFRTSAHASALFAGALVRLLTWVDAALGRPDPLDVVDLGAGRGELLAALTAAVPEPLSDRLRLRAVELAPAPDEPSQPLGSPPVSWRRDLPDAICGLLLATEWLDNVPVEVAQVDPAGLTRYVLVDPASGQERPGDPVTGPDADWLARWWPLAAPGTRAEIGRSRDEAWAAALGRLRRGVALAVDYGHVAGQRPPLGTLTGFRSGREVPPVPDGSCDLTAHVAVDALAAAGRAAALGMADPLLLRQAAALRRLGVDGTRPPLELAHRDPAGYLRRLASAGAGAELTDPAGLGSHYWLLQPVALDANVTVWPA